MKEKNYMQHINLLKMRNDVLKTHEQRRFKKYGKRDKR